MVKAIVWWLMSACGVTLSILFLLMGIDLCRASYHLNHPYHFIFTFFASNLIILISAVLLIGLVVRIILRLRPGHPPDGATHPQVTPDSSQSSDRSNGYY
jgi:hypothetical protein